MQITKRRVEFQFVASNLHERLSALRSLQQSYCLLPIGLRDTAVPFLEGRQNQVGHSTLNKRKGATVARDLFEEFGSGAI
jgi:hypothetical protein